MGDFTEREKGRKERRKEGGKGERKEGRKVGRIPISANGILLNKLFSLILVLRLYFAVQT